ncbi:MAG: AI-2E family transporter [Crocinitomicaceae bacterium]|nr:AI-2E family transporter [Crocinitomicaceae bacterium]
MKIDRTASWLIVITIIVLALIVGQSVFIPFIVALLIWFVVKKTRNSLDKIEFVHKYIPKWIKTFLASLLVFSILVIVGRMLTTNIEKLVLSSEVYRANIEVISLKISKMVNDLVGIDANTTSEAIKNSFKSILNLEYLQSLFSSLSGILGNMMMIVFYTIFLFIEEGLFSNKIKLMFGNPEKSEQYLGIMTKIDKMLSRYIILKSMINLVTATIAYIVLYFVGIDSPFFWAALIFFFSFIPSIGPILGTTLPAIFSLIQFAEFVPFLIILFVIGSFQVAIGNYLEPRIMGNTLNISPLFGIFALAIWGSLWGITGMLLSVPITVAMIIVMAQFPNTRNVAILLSEKGKL